MPNLSKCTTKALKEALSSLGLPTTGNKSELLLRLSQVEDFDMATLEKRMENAEQDGDDPQDEAASMERMMDVFRREKEIAERELALVRRELDMARSVQANVVTQRAERVANQAVTSTVNATQAPMRMCVTKVADLLCAFSGSADTYEIWEKQVRFLKEMYGLPEDEMKILIGMRIKGKALEWFHSKPEHILMATDQLLNALRAMFCHRVDKIAIRRRFEERTWKKDESFSEYVHDKVIMANRISLPEDEMLQYVIEGIPDANLRDSARIHGFTTKESLLQAFEAISLRGPETTKHGGKSEKNSAKRESEVKSGYSNKVSDAKSVEKKERMSVRHCFNCGMSDHINAKCPSKDLGRKCFKCGKHGHISAECSEKKSDVKSTNVADVCVTSSKSAKRVSVNGHDVDVIIDTASDISIVRADQYLEFGQPAIVKTEMSFKGVGNVRNRAIGFCDVRLRVDGHEYKIRLYVVANNLLNHKMLIGTDFLDHVRLVREKGVCMIVPLSESEEHDEVPEILRIEAIEERGKSEIQISEFCEPKNREKIQNLVETYEPNKCREVGVKMTIVLKDEEPIYQRARRLSEAEKQEVNAQIQEWMSEGIVRESHSDFCSPIVIVKKKDGASRLCVDYRMINQKIIKDRYPLPLIEDQLDLLQDAKVFSTLDLRNGFFHVEVDEASRKYTSFVVPDGQFEFCRVPFGLCNSPATFQKFINVVFRDLITERVVLTYMDDLIVPSKDEKSGVENIERVFKVASEAGLTFKWSKCNFLKREVEFLGHVVGHGEVRPSENKTEAVRNFPKPKSVKQVQSFLGLTGYFRKFIPKYSLIARPLTNLLRNEVEFRFEDEENDAFTSLKEALSTKPVLSLYRVDAETELHTDASMHGYGAMLVQKSCDDGQWHPIYFASGKTSSAEERYCSYELEVLAIVRSLKKFRVYLIGIPFKIVTDCKAFAMTMRKKDVCVRVARWAFYLEDFNYTIEHRPGKNMAHVDALSRNPLPTCLLVDQREDGLAARLRKAQHDDEEIRRIIEDVEKRERKGFVMRGGLLFKEVDGDIRLMVPRALSAHIIRSAHDKGHFSVAKTEAILKKDHWIPDMRQKIERVIDGCVECIMAERKGGKQEGYLNSIAKGVTPLDTLHIDHLGPLASTKKSYRHIFVVIDGFTKFTWLYATRSTTAAEAIDRLKKRAAIFGNPRRIVSDRGTAFTAKEFEDYCKAENIEHILTTTGIPRANGQVERVNRTLIPLITKLTAPKSGEWFKHLNTAQQYLNTAFHRSIGTTPFQVMFGTQPRFKNDESLRELVEQEFVATFQEERDEVREHAKDRIQRIQKENRRSYNKKRKEARAYREGDIVAIKRTQQGPGLKFAAKYLGPYEISRVLRNDRYLVQKLGDHEGPRHTSTAADCLKPWTTYVDTDEEDDVHSGSNARVQDGRV